MATTDVLTENKRFVLLRRFRDRPDAFLFQSILDSADIECFLADENTIRMDWFWSNLLGGIKLFVRAADMGAASALFDQPFLESFDAEGIGEYQQPGCANCNSIAVSFNGLNKPVDYTRAPWAGLDRSTEVFGSAIPAGNAGPNPSRSLRRVSYERSLPFS